MRDDEMAAVAATWLADAHAAWPELVVDEAAFVAQCAARLPEDAGPEQALAIHAADLWLTAACAAGDMLALAAFEERARARRGPALARGRRLDPGPAPEERRAVARADHDDADPAQERSSPQATIVARSRRGPGRGRSQPGRAGATGTMRHLAWLRNMYREVGLRDTIWMIGMPLAILLMIVSSIGYYLSGASSPHVPVTTMVMWAAKRAERRASDALLIGFEIAHVRADGRADLRGFLDETVATFRYRSRALTAAGPECEILVGVTGHKSTTLSLGQPSSGASCDLPAVRAPTCGADAIWKRAIHDGAPADGAATLAYEPLSGSNDAVLFDPDHPIGGRWRFTLGRFEHAYDDDCDGRAREPQVASAAQHRALEDAVVRELSLRAGPCWPEIDAGARAAMVKARVRTTIRPDGHAASPQVAVLDSRGTAVTTAAAAAIAVCITTTLGESHLPAPGVALVDDLDVDLASLP